MQIKSNIILILILIQIINTSCSIYKKSSNNVSIDSSLIKKEINDTKLNNIVSSKEEQKLIIADRCIGCGRCVLLAPENFEMNLETLKSKVISNKKLDNDKVKQAIDGCPVYAISIE